MCTAVLLLSLIAGCGKTSVPEQDPAPSTQEAAAPQSTRADDKATAEAPVSKPAPDVPSSNDEPQSAAKGSDEPAAASIDPAAKKSDATFFHTSRELANEYRKGQEAFEKKYGEQTVELVGKVVGLSPALFPGTGDSIKLEGVPGDFDDLRVSCRTTIEQPWKTAKPGQTVRLVGKVPLLVSGPDVEQCRILEVSGPEPVSVSVASLTREILADSTAASRKYSRKALLVTGEISKVSFRESGVANLTLKPADARVVFVCDFMPSAEKVVRGLKAGQKIALWGEFPLFVDGQIDLTDCAVVGGADDAMAAAEKPDFVLTARDYAKEYLKNDLALLKKYLQKKTELTGVVKTVAGSPDSDARILILEGFPSEDDVLVGTVSCYLRDDPLPVVPLPGQSVRVEGKLAFGSAAPVLHSCRLLDVAGPDLPTVEADALASEHRKDLNAFNARYRDKHLVIAGRIASVRIDEKNLLESVTLELATEPDSPRIVCTSGFISLDQAKKLKAGDRVRVLGQYVVSLNRDELPVMGCVLLKPPD